MEGPGMSLFQGAGSIHINNSAQERLEEQEEAEDQRRRNEELKNKLENGFDDLIYDDEVSSVNSSANFTVDATHHPVCKGEEKRTYNQPPTYVESLNHLKETQHDTHQGYCETPKTHYQVQYTEEHNDKCYHSPYGAGDGLSNFAQVSVPVNGMKNYNDAQGMIVIEHEQLKLMYEMRVKECQQLAAEKQELRSKLDLETDSLRARLAVALADRDKAELSLQEAHQLLASSKHSMVELEQQSSALREQLVGSEQEKEQLRLELRAANVSLQDAQQRLHTFQVAQSHNADTLFREQQDRHRIELDRLQEDLQKAKSRMQEKDNEIKMLERKCKEKDRDKEELLIEKGATINRLARELEAAQTRFTSGETHKLKEKLSQLNTERNAAREQVKELGSKLEVTAHELMVCRNKLSACQKEYEDWRTTLQQIVNETLPDTTYIGESPSPGKLATLKDILMRYKQQAMRFANLQEELSKRDKKLETYRRQESDLRSEVEVYKGIEMQLNSRVAMLQNKLELLGSNSDSELLDSYKQQLAHTQAMLDDLKAEHKALELKFAELELDYEKLKCEKASRASAVQDANADLLRELERCSSQLKHLLKENAELKNLYLKVCTERDAKCREMKQIEYKIKQIEKDRQCLSAKETEYQEEIEKGKRHVEKLTADLVSEREELDRANKRISELHKEFTEKQKEFTDKLNKYIEEERSAVRKELEICNQCEKHVKTIKNLEEQVNKCQLRLATQQSNEELMQELKSKGEFFKKYIVEKYQKLQDLRNVATNTETEWGANTLDRGALESDHGGHEDTIASRTSLMLKEKEIRDQIAEKFTLEIKTIEMNCSKKLKEMENDHISNINKMKTLLERKADEVETLKQFILSERTKITEILEAKENEISLLIKENNSLQEEFQNVRDKTTELQNSLEKAQAKIAKLKIDNEKKNLESSHEREKWLRGKSELMQRMQVLEARTAQMEAQHELLKEKYKSVKKTALTYKEYASKKDEHVEDELKRIKANYNEIVTELQEKIQALVKQRQQNEVTERISKFQSNFNAMMSDSTRPL